MPCMQDYNNSSEKNNVNFIAIYQLILRLAFSNPMSPPKNISVSIRLNTAMTNNVHVNMYMYMRREYFEVVKAICAARNCCHVHIYTARHTN